ncbi:MAG: ABC transporter permease subunit [Isosphaeraceae bacterium]
MILVLLRRHLIEARWPLGLCTGAFFGLSWLTTWMAVRFERLIELGEIGPASRRYGFLRALGGPAMDYSTTALEICWWNHPVIVLTVLAWAVSRGATGVAGEIERGTIDVTLSRPISRSLYLSSQVLFAVLGLVAMVLALVAGNVFGSLIYTLKSPPSLLTLTRPSIIVISLGMAIYGYTLPFSAIDVVRWRPSLLSSAITLAGLVALSIAPQFPDYQKLLENLSVFQLYAPVTVALKVDPLAFNVAVLLLIFAIGLGVSYALFARRDLPSNS